MCCVKVKRKKVFDKSVNGVLLKKKRFWCAQNVTRAVHLYLRYIYAIFVNKKNVDNVLFVVIRNIRYNYY